MPSDDERAQCPFCRGLPRTFGTARSACAYGGPAGELIRNLKYRHQEQAGILLARLLAGVLGNHLGVLRDEGRIDLVVPVPMHWWRQTRRGYNQAATIAEPLARILKMEFDAEAARRRRRTVPQARTADHRARLENVRGAFDVPEPGRITGRRVLLVDDVMTTGATMSAAAGALLDAGAVEVHAVSVARAFPSRPAGLSAAS